MVGDTTIAVAYACWTAELMREIIEAVEAKGIRVSVSSGPHDLAHFTVPTERQTEASETISDTITAYQLRVTSPRRSAMFYDNEEKAQEGGE